MKQFTLGSLVGLFVGLSIGATTLQEEKTDPCVGWKIDCLALEAAVLMSMNNDYDKYQNVRDNIGIVMSRLIKSDQKYIWEEDGIPKSERISRDRFRDLIVEESIKFALEMARENEKRNAPPLDA